MIPLQHRERAAEVGHALEARLKRAIGRTWTDPCGSGTGALARHINSDDSAEGQDAERLMESAAARAAPPAARPGRRARSRATISGEHRVGERRELGLGARHARNSASAPKPVAAASRRWLRLRRTAGSAEVRDQRAIAQRPAGAGERGAALGHHARRSPWCRAPAATRRRERPGRARRPGAGSAAAREDQPQHAEQQQRRAEMERDRPGAVLVEHGEAAEPGLDQQQQDQRRGVGRHPRLAPAHPPGEPADHQHQRPEDHAREQAVQPLQHHLEVA